MTDAALMARYCDGDAAAFRELYAAVAPKLLNYLARMTNDRALAEDLLQLTFLKVHKARGAYVRNANPVPWMYAIAHRTCLDALRKRTRAKVRVAKDPTKMPEPAADILGRPEGTAPENADPTLTAAALAALDSLPTTQREAVVLTKLQGKSVAEAAEIAGITRGAMKVRAHRGYQALRKVLGAKTNPV